jgi:uncharacterized protein
MNDKLVAKTAAYVRKKIYSNPSGSDWYHIERVLDLARRIQAVEGGDLEIIELSVLLHDFRSYKHHNFDEKKGMLALTGMMDVLDIPEETQEAIHGIIVSSQYLGEDTKKAKTLEGKIVQDADWLDALGAIGIARTFAAGGHIDRMMHDPHKKPRKYITKDDYLYRKTDSTSLNYFYEKLLKLPALMNTATAKELAVGRERFLRLFIDEFLAEWKGQK